MSSRTIFGALVSGRDGSERALQPRSPSNQFGANGIDASASGTSCGDFFVAPVDGVTLIQSLPATTNETHSGGAQRGGYIGRGTNAPTDGCHFGRRGPARLWPGPRCEPRCRRV